MLGHRGFHRLLDADEAIGEAVFQRGAGFGVIAIVFGDLGVCFSLGGLQFAFVTLQYSGQGSLTPLFGIGGCLVMLAFDPVWRWRPGAGGRI
jgi:hypothetical protein